MIVAFTGTSGIGQAFMDWSFYYLSGRKEFWNYKFGMMPVLDNPVGDRNAHSHEKNHMAGNEIKKFIELAREKISHDGRTITFHPYVDVTDNPELQIESLKEMIHTLKGNGIKIIMMKQTKPYPYFASERNEVTDSQERPHLKNWLGTKTDDVIKIREMVSLKMIGNKKKWLEQIESFCEGMSDNFDLMITDTQWADQTEKMVLEIFDTLGHTIRDDRLGEWREVRKVWRTNYGKLIDWYEIDLPKISQAIVTGLEMDLEPVGLGFVKQVSIMAHLMRDHGRRLLLTTEEFPKNTRDLHRFLK